MQCMLYKKMWWWWWWCVCLVVCGDGGGGVVVWCGVVCGVWCVVCGALWVVCVRARMCVCSCVCTHLNVRVKPEKRGTESRLTATTCDEDCETLFQAGFQEYSLQGWVVGQANVRT